MRLTTPYSKLEGISCVKNLVPNGAVSNKGDFVSVASSAPKLARDEHDATL